MYVATSWDDGLVSDKPLLSILEKHGLRSSFALTPLRYQTQSVPNDDRNVVRYGSIIAKSELRQYADHDVCNHTASHFEMHPQVHPAAMAQEILLGKWLLEDYFQTAVRSMVWPYGCSTPAACNVAAHGGHLLGRTTQHGRTNPDSACWNVVPVHWRQFVQDPFRWSAEYVVTCGHTYELTTTKDWDLVDELYRLLATEPSLQPMTLSELGVYLHAQ